MRSLFLKSALILAVVVSWSGVPAAEKTDAMNGSNPAFKAIGPLTFVAHFMATKPRCSRPDGYAVARST